MSATAFRTRPSTASVASILETAYDRHARRPALVDGQQTRTYAELAQRVHRVVDALGTLGGVRGDRLALLGSNSAAYIEVTHAAFVGGFVRVALSSKLHPREVVGILEDCTPRFLFIGPEWVESVAVVRNELPSVEQVVVMGAASEWGIGYDDLLDSGEAEPPRSLPTPDDLCALLYTSGTTGRPKGAMLSHGNWAAMIRNSLIELPPVSDDDVLLHVAPLSHFSGYVEPTYSARGALHVVEAPFEPERVVTTIDRRAVTALPLVPTMLNMLVPAAEASDADVSSMRTIVYGGSSIASDRLARAVAAFGEVFVQFFGLSETPMPLSALSARDHRLDADGTAPSRLASAGRVNPFVELRICDDERRSLERGAVGEIVVRGDVVMTGYWKRAEETAEMIDTEGWAATGDLGRIDDEGYLYIVDRKRDMLVTGGYNVYPTEVENAISALTAVREVAVVGVPDERWGESVMAVVVAEPGRSLDAETIVDACRKRLAGYKKPRAVEFVDELPKTGSGKVMRRAIRDRYLASREGSVG